jgi:phenylalanyl-tRNA synthetase beta chain
VTAPSFRPDITQPADLVEEVARFDGYAEVPAEMPSRQMAGPLASDPSLRFARASREVMLGVGFTEVRTLALIAPAENQRFGGIEDGDPVKVSNPLSAELSELRRSLIPGLLGALRFNLNRQASAFHAFEIGRVYLMREGSVVESERLSGVTLGEYVRGAIGQPSILADFATVKGVVETYLESIGGRMTASFERPAAEQAPFLHPNRAARIMVDGHVVGLLGELHPWEALRLEVAGSCNLFELDLTRLLAYGRSLPEMVSVPPRFPAVRRDAALVVDAEMPAAVLLGALKESAPLLLEDIRVFDVYEGEALPPGKKSVAVACLYRAAQRTLTDEEVNRAHSELIGKVREKLGIELR